MWPILPFASRFPMPVDDRLDSSMAVSAISRIAALCFAAPALCLIVSTSRLEVHSSLLDIVLHE
jgi:hypothetical protein